MQIRRYIPVSMYLQQSRAPSLILCCTTVSAYLSSTMAQGLCPKSYKAWACCPALYARPALPGDCHLHETAIAR
jgi:hypothetical protein